MPHGTRILSAKEAKEREEDIAQQAAQAREDERYDKTPAAAKVLGGIATAASAVMPEPPHLRRWRSSGTAPAAYSSGVTEGLTGGLGQGSSGKASMRRSERRRRQVRATGHRPEGRQPLRSRRRQRRGHRYRPRRWRWRSSRAARDGRASHALACKRRRRSARRASQQRSSASEAPSRAASSAVASTRESNYSRTTT